ncbi:phosphopantetheine-binding protein [Gracilibacillus sp. JCM 18860]|uniref:phosphopantetheine-binding protein n=1 Tax=Gracilibacillus sp. JCM 18860 TaxID=1306159 RepID=UPI0006D0BCF7
MGDNLPQRINLPTYPFERKSFWPKKNNQSSKKEPSVNTSPLPEELVSLSPKTKPSFSLTNTKQQELKQEQIQLPSLTNMPKWSDRQRVQALSQQTLSKIDQPVVEHQVSQYSEEDGLKLQDMLIDSLVQTLFMEETTVDINRNFYDMGLDSILGVEWMRLINKTLNLSLDATTLYDYPTIHELTQYIQSIHEGDQQPSTANGTLITELAESLAEIMYLDPSDIDEDVQFSDLGLDSILGVEWIRVLNKRYGVTMEATTLYDYPTLREFANWMQHQNKKDDEESVLLSSPTLEEILEKVEQGTLEMNKAYNLLQEYNLV